MVDNIHIKILTLLSSLSSGKGIKPCILYHLPVNPYSHMSPQISSSSEVTGFSVRTSEKTVLLCLFCSLKISDLIPTLTCRFLNWVTDKGQGPKKRNKVQTGNDTGHRASHGNESNTFDTITKVIQFCSFSEDFCVPPMVCQFVDRGSRKYNICEVCQESAQGNWVLTSREQQYSLVLYHVEEYISFPFKTYFQNFFHFAKSHDKEKYEIFILENLRTC